MDKSRESAIRVVVTQVTGKEVVNEAASFVTGNKVKINIYKWLASEHSPIRDWIFKIQLYNIPAFVATHLKTHNRDVINQVTESHRTDYATKYGKDVSEDRNALVNHTMTLNAQALITITKSRICTNASVETQKVWREVRKAVSEIAPEMREFMVVECVYRNGLCPHSHSKCKYNTTPLFKKELKEYVKHFKHDSRIHTD